MEQLEERANVLHLRPYVAPCYKEIWFVTVAYPCVRHASASNSDETTEYYPQKESPCNDSLLFAPKPEAAAAKPEWFAWWRQAAIGKR
ncbi:MAG: hypothetical protein R3A44_01550 [Caldilineaceae bacterium]